MRKYGWKPDTPDIRDFKFSEVRESRVALLPTKIDLRQYCSKVEDQGDLGSCTAQAIVGCLELLENKAGLPYVELSRLFVYFNERLLQNTIEIDSGAELRIGMKALINYGVCSETWWEYDVKQAYKRPRFQAYQEAERHKLTEYQRLETLAQMKKCLADGYPFVFGVGVYDSFESDEVAKTGIIPLPSYSERCHGGHAMACVGYDDVTARFTVRNSWGEDWGDKGYCYIPYTYLNNNQLADDFWTIRRMEI